jgi:hypothetical protein
MRCVILISVLAALSFGCSVRGFSNLPDGPAMPSTLRSAAAVARAEADALDQIADQNEGIIRQVVGAAQSAAESLGAPALLTGLLGAGAGFLVPTPGQRKREQVAEARGKLGGAVEGKSGAA